MGSQLNYSSLAHLEIWKEPVQLLFHHFCFCGLESCPAHAPRPAVEMWPAMKEFPTGGRTRKFPADNAEHMQIAFALFANIFRILFNFGPDKD